MSSSSDDQLDNLAMELKQLMPSRTGKKGGQIIEKFMN